MEEASEIFHRSVNRRLEGRRCRGTKYGMSVCTAVSERVDGDPHRPFDGVLQGRDLRGNEQSQLVEVDVRVQLVQPCLRRDDRGPGYERGLDEPGYARCSFAMPEAGLQRADHARSRPPTGSSDQ